MDTLTVAPPVVERRAGLSLAGFRRHYILAQDLATVMKAVARQWHEFHLREAELGPTDGSDYYGVCLKIMEGDASFDYFCGMAVPDLGEPAQGFSRLAIPPLRYAVFRHLGPTSTLPTTYFAIFGTLLPEAGLAPADPSCGLPEFIERFDEGYDRQTGTGGPEILVPLQD